MIFSRSLKLRHSLTSFYRVGICLWLTTDTSHSAPRLSAVRNDSARLRPTEKSASCFLRARCRSTVHMICRCRSTTICTPYAWSSRYCLVLDDNQTIGHLTFLPISLFFFSKQCFNLEYVPFIMKSNKREILKWRPARLLVSTGSNVDLDSGTRLEKFCEDYKPCFPCLGAWRTNVQLNVRIL